MGRIVMVMILGAALFFAGAWQLGLLEKSTDSVKRNDEEASIPVAAIETLGADLYAAEKFPEIHVRERKGRDPIVVPGIFNAIEEEEVPSQVPGRILFIGEQVDDSAVLVAGSAPFLTEPYYFAKVYAGGTEKFVKFYRRLYQGETIKKNQILALIEPAKALGEVLGKQAKIDLAVAELDAAVAGEAEGYDRYLRARILYPKAMSKEDYGAAVLTWKKLVSEKISKVQGVKMAEIEKRQADIELHMHEIRAVMPYAHSSIKAIVRQSGSAVKPGDPVLIVQNLERLQAEAQIEEQYFTRIRDKDRDKNGLTATIEPTILEEPLHEFPGHNRDVTSVAVAKDMKIVSGSEDGSVCVWTVNTIAPLYKFDHDAAVNVVACTPTGADKNICLVGCADGSIHLWDLDAKDAAAIKVIKNAHGDDKAITSLAFSPDGKLFASGALDGSIRMWSADGTELYAFIPANGVAQAHEDAVTALHFTPQCRLVSAGRDHTLRVWLLKEKGAADDGKAIRNREGNVPQLGVSHDGKWMLFDQAQGRTLKLLSVESHTLKHTLSVPTNATPFDSLALFSPDSSLILTASASEGRLQLWKTPDADSRGFEVRQFATREHLPVSCAAFSPDAGKNSFAVSGSGHKVYLWSIPTKAEVSEHRIEGVRMTLKTHSLDPSTKQARIGFEVANPSTPAHPNGRFEAGRPVRIVID
jgi:WD40 repeat protein